MEQNEALPDVTPARTEELLEQFGWVRSLARTLVADESEAEDLTQETILTALRSPPRRQGGLRGWLGTVVRNLAISRYRTGANRSRRERERTARVESPSALSVVQQAELHRRVVDAVLSLREPYRTVVLLRFFEEESTASIAVQRRTTEATVRSQVKRGLEQLRRRLERDFGGWQTALFVLGFLAVSRRRRSVNAVVASPARR